MKGDTLLLAGLFSLLMGLLSFGLPHTPPQREGAKPWAFLEALKMFKDKNFLVFAVISFVVATELQFYYVLTSPFLTSPAIGVSQKHISAVMTIAQVAEIFVMAFMLSWALKKFGMRRTLTLGILAWPIRYIIFVIGEPSWLVIASLALHGFCYVFFFTAAFIYVDNIAPKDIRAFGPEPDRHHHPRLRELCRQPVQRLGPEPVHERDPGCGRRGRQGHRLARDVPGPDGPDPALPRRLPGLFQGEENAGRRAAHRDGASLGLGNVNTGFGDPRKRRERP
jgi:hypothetical protein